MQVVILKTVEEVAQYGASIFIKQIQKNSHSVLGLAAGSTPFVLYKNMIKAYRFKDVSYRNVCTFNVDEYLGLSANHPQSYRYFMDEYLFNHIDIDKSQTSVPLSSTTDPVQVCQCYETEIQTRGGIDIQLLGIGRNGHIGFNEPFSNFSSRTRVKTLSQETIRDNARFFSSDECQPHRAITMGIGTILEAKKVVLMAIGQPKSMAVQAMIEGQVTQACPASALQLHGDVVVIVDQAAASTLKN
ncbi:MAG: glucosamine-6-phosphate deaminase [Spongiibacteraceae bacterium]|nr:glucosamine-6-phosphate deaminase [Spongiibacteraceae bacterium]